jgi:hypothetical protein
MRNLKTKNSAVDLTDLAIGIIILGIVVSIGAVILLEMRDSRLTDLPTFTVSNEQVSIPAASTALNKVWFKEITTVYNATGNIQLSSGNWTISVSDINGQAKITNMTLGAGNNYTEKWNVTYTCYNSSRVDFKLPNDAAIGLGEYGNWFKIIVVVGVAAVVLALIFMAFGGKKIGGSTGIGGEY